MMLWDYANADTSTHELVVPGDTVPTMFWNAVLQRGEKAEDIVLMQSEALGKLRHAELVVGLREGLKDIECVGNGLDQVVFFIPFHGCASSLRGDHRSPGKVPGCLPVLTGYPLPVHSGIPPWKTMRYV